MRKRPISTGNSAGGNGGSGASKKKATQLAPSSGSQITTDEAVNITTPKKESIVVRGTYGVFVDGSSSIAKSVLLEWSGGAKTVSTQDEYWQTTIPLSAGEHKLIAKVSREPSKVKFTVILPPKVEGYTAEEIQEVKTDRPGHPQQGPTKSGYIAKDAGLLTHEKQIVNKEDHIDDVKGMVSSVGGDYNLFYSGSGDQAFFEKRVDFLLAWYKYK